ncbi:hypothetical protein [Nitrososphaera viennensis]|uniref:PRC-barrel domain-containing protein n=2 Tax=Nitrososphaera viennensis TaxID=1034015 RepID=A0A060HMY3_9ARCH|nr:hypothetical protein [Nitrososphaera viennensis]AIC16853.1 hypothetical protein NVIE_2639 [Nitrososphaera viennensis EN76]UVS68757.1 hypothetical protein NWT39_12730 [Nitrososphaera viennensis]
MQSSSEPAVLRWDRVIHKGVRTKDGMPLGNIASEEQDSIVVLGTRSRIYKIPKSRVESFDGSQVLVDIPAQEMGSYRV